MKRKTKISFIVLFLIMLFSCDYETHVINTVHEDGSITRKVTMMNSKEEFEPKFFRVPVDSTWQTEITWEVNASNDTSWLLTAEKHFASVEELNEDYEKDTGSNRLMKRGAHFTKSFKWFTTVFRFSETIDRVLTISCPMSDFLTEEESQYFYLPDKVVEDLREGADSLRFREMADTLEEKVEHWIWSSLLRQWIGIFYDLCSEDPGLTITREEMQSKESLFVQHLIEDESQEETDSSENGEEGEMDAVFIAVLGEKFFASFETEIDSSLALLEETIEPFVSANKYNMEIRMPGRIIASNGYADTDPQTGNGGGILWTVEGEYFLTQPYEMWVESRVNNPWAWIVTALFILFVATGFVTRKTRHRKEKH